MQSFNANRTGLLQIGSSFGVEHPRNKIGSKVRWHFGGLTPPHWPPHLGGSGNYENINICLPRRCHLMAYSLSSSSLSETEYTIAVLVAVGRSVARGAWKLTSSMAC